MTTSRTRPKAALFPLATVCLAVSLGAGGCASSQSSAPKVASEFTPADAELFDEGVDFIGSSLALDGRWRDDWIRELKGRVARADAIGTVTVRAFRTDSAPQGHNTFRIMVDVANTIEGRLPGDLVLTTTPESSGYRTVESHVDNLQTGDFLVFVKWAEAPDGSAKPRWHLSPATEELTAAVRKELESGQPPSPQPQVTVRPLEE